MHVPNHFAMDPQEARDLLATAGAADLVTAHERGIVATYLPFLLDPDVGEQGALLTHVARNNSQARDPVIGEALVIAHGPDHYISPRWSPSMAQSGQVVPTWNYLTVHAYGRLIVHDDPTWTEDVIARMTAAHEEDYSLDDVPADYVARMLRAIVGIEVRLTRVEAKAKMSQNKRPEDVRGIVAGLRGADDADPTAEWMLAHSVPAADRRAALIADLAAARRSSPARPAAPR